MQMPSYIAKKTKKWPLSIEGSSMKKVVQAPTDLNGLDDALWMLCVKEFESLTDDEADALPDAIFNAISGVSTTEYTDKPDDLNLDEDLWIYYQKEYLSLSQEEVGALPKMIRLAFTHVCKIRFTKTEIKAKRKGDIVRELKALHKDKCQVCGLTLKLQGDMTYSEGHHVKPVGYFDGPDIKSNIIIVCPNCHVLLGKWCVLLDDVKGVDQEFIEFNNARVKAKTKDVEYRMRRARDGKQ